MISGCVFIFQTPSSILFEFEIFLSTIFTHYAQNCPLKKIRVFFLKHLTKYQPVFLLNFYENSVAILQHIPLNCFLNKY